MPLLLRHSFWTLSVEPLIECFPFYFKALSSLANVIPKINLEHKQRRTICFETGIQNTQMAGAIINLSFPLVQIVRIVIFPLAYLISQVH